MVAPSSALASTSWLVKIFSIEISFAQKKTPAPGGERGLGFFRSCSDLLDLAGHSPRDGGNKKNEYEQERGGRQGHLVFAKADRGQLHVHRSKNAFALKDMDKRPISKR